MRMIVPYNKEIVFNTKIASITSISLEYEANILDDELVGDFLISGDYKIHEVSINKEPFKYRLPFSITLADSIIRDSLKYDINNFTYECINDDTLKVNIEFLLEGEEVETPLQEEAQEQVETFEEPVPPKEETEEDNDHRQESIEAAKTIDTMLSQVSNDLKEEIQPPIKPAEKNIADTTINNSIVNSNIIMNKASSVNDSYVIYHIHVAMEGETLDEIATKYNVTKDLIFEYNNIVDLKPGDKVLIPEIPDE